MPTAGKAAGRRNTRAKRTGKAKHTQKRCALLCQANL